jgi:predicted transcriptional regulator
LTQSEFTKRLGTSAANLCDAEKGHKRPRFHSVVKFARKLGISDALRIQVTLQDMLKREQLKFVGDSYVVTIARESNSEGDRINLLITNMTTKATSVAQVEDGSKAPLITMTPDGKFQVSLVCRKK